MCVRVGRGCVSVCAPGRHDRRKRKVIVWRVVSGRRRFFLFSHHSSAGRTFKQRRVNCWRKNPNFWATFSLFLFKFNQCWKRDDVLVADVNISFTSSVDSVRITSTVLAILCYELEENAFKVGAVSQAAHSWSMEHHELRSDIRVKLLKVHLTLTAGWCFLHDTRRNVEIWEEYGHMLPERSIYQPAGGSNSVRISTRKFWVYIINYFSSKINLHPIIVFIKCNF